MYLKENEDLTSRNTFGFHLKTACLAVYDNEEELRRLLEAPGLPHPLFALGEGSNLVLTGDWPGTMLYSEIKHIDILSENEEEMVVKVSSGIIWDDFCAWCAERCLWGVENLSMIPGQTGSAAVQNIGAYGMEIQESILRVECTALPEGNSPAEKKIFPHGQCHYGYRESFFKKEGKGKYIVTAVVFHLGKTPAPRLEYGNLKDFIAVEHPSLKMEEFTPSVIRSAVMAIRSDKLPAVEEAGSAGSFFKNPVVNRKDLEYAPHYPVPGEPDRIKIPAAWLIEQCGWKGYRKGCAGVWHKQPLILVNHGGARPQDIITLEKQIIDSVKERFGIVLEPEAEHLPPLESETQDKAL